MTVIVLTAGALTSTAYTINADSSSEYCKLASYSTVSDVLPMQTSGDAFFDELELVESKVPLAFLLLLVSFLPFGLF